VQVPLAQVSGPVHTSPSSQVPPLIGVPAHVPSAHMSGFVQALASLQLWAFDRAA
jgi:hypothetical protein